LRISRGEAFAYERHWRRLEKDATITRLPMPYAAAKVRVHLHEVIRANKVTEGCARIYLVYNTIGFWQSGERQPPVDLIIYTAGRLEGVTRGILMEIAPEAGVSVLEQALRPEDLYSADEVFVSSTNRNLIGVGEIAGNKIPAPGPVCGRLNDLFDAYVADYVS